MPNRQVARRGNGISRYARAAVRGVAAGMGVARRAAKVFKKSKPQTANATGNGGVVTNQFDTKVEYRKRGKRRGSKKSRKFVNKIQRIIASADDYSSTLVLVDAVNIGSFAGSWAYYNSSLGSINGTPYKDDDFYRISQNYLSGLGNVTNRKINMISVHMDTILTNTSPISVMIFTHTLVPRRNLMLQDAQVTIDAVGMLNNAAIIDQAGPTISKISFSNPGFDVWTSSNFLKMFKIVSTRKTLLSANQTLSLDMGIKYNMYFQNIGEFESATSAALSQVVYTKQSKILFHTFFGIGTDSTNNAVSTYPAVNVTFNTVKTMKFSVPNIAVTTGKEAANTGYLYNYVV